MACFSLITSHWQKLVCLGGRMCPFLKLLNYSKNPSLLLSLTTLLQICTHGVCNTIHLPSPRLWVNELFLPTRFHLKLLQPVFIFTLLSLLPFIWTSFCHSFHPNIFSLLLFSFLIFPVHLATVPLSSILNFVFARCSCRPTYHISRRSLSLLSLLWTPKGQHMSISSTDTSTGHPWATKPK